MANQKTVWNKEMKETLIDLYREREILWNTKLKEYMNRDKRRNAMKEIAEQLKVDINEATKEINTLRTQFNYSKRSVKSGSSGGGNQFWLTEKMSFLNDYITPKKSQSNFEVRSFSFIY